MREERDRDDQIDALSPAALELYLSRLGLPRDRRNGQTPGFELLELLVTRQLATVPFENFGIHRGQIVQVDPPSIEHKILHCGLGGICYEVNGLLAAALRAHGFGVEFVGASVRTVDGKLGRPLGHMALLVSARGENWLTDVGFGGSSVLEPVSDGERDTPLDITTTTGRYRTDPLPRGLEEFADVARWHSTSPDARFTGSIICSVTVNGRRSTLSRNRSENFAFTVTDLATGERRRDTVTDDDVLALLSRHFGVRLEDVPVARTH